MCAKGSVSETRESVTLSLLFAFVYAYRCQVHPVACAVRSPKQGLKRERGRVKDKGEESATTAQDSKVIEAVAIIEEIETEGEGDQQVVAVTGVVLPPLGHEP